MSQRHLTGWNLEISVENKSLLNTGGAKIMRKIYLGIRIKGVPTQKYISKKAMLFGEVLSSLTMVVT